jgi:hypothetical protein
MPSFIANNPLGVVRHTSRLNTYHDNAVLYLFSAVGTGVHATKLRPFSGSRIDTARSYVWKFLRVSTLSKLSMGFDS